MFKNKIEKDYKKVISLFSILLLANCSYLGSDDYSNLEFNTNPNYYAEAKINNNTKIPKYIADNLDKEPFYPIPDEKTKLNGTIDINPVPPTLEGKIRTYG